MTIRGSRKREREAADRIDAEFEAAQQRVEDAIQRSADFDEHQEQAEAERERVERQVVAAIADARARALEIRAAWRRQTHQIWFARRAKAKADKQEKLRREKPVPVFTAPPKANSIIYRLMVPLVAIGSFLFIKRNAVGYDVVIEVRPISTKEDVPLNVNSITHKEIDYIKRSSEFSSLSIDRSKEVFGDTKVFSFVSQAFRDQGGDRTEAALDTVSPLLVLALAEPATSSRARSLYAAAVVGGANPAFAAELALPALLEDAAAEAERALARSLDPSFRPGDPEPDDESESGGGGYEPPSVRP